MGERQKQTEEGVMPVDTSSVKRGRGRPKKIPKEWVIGRAPNYRTSLGYAWPELCAPLLAATTEEQVIDAFQKHAPSYANNFVPRFAADILALIHDPLFPRRRAKAQIGFLADSLAGRPDVSARRSRDICQEERRKAEYATHIISYEFKIECSCGFKGFSKDHGCPKCTAKIELSLSSIYGGGLF